MNRPAGRGHGAGPVLLQFTDPHIYGDAASRLADLDTRRSFEAVLALARASGHAPDAVLVTGDLAMDASAAAYEWLRAGLDTLGPPVYCIPGNHDDPARLRTVMGAMASGSETVVDLGAWRVMLLNTHVPGVEWGETGRAQLDGLSTALAAARDRHVLIALHHPPVAIGSPWMDRMGLRDSGLLWEVVRAAPAVRALIWGHAHQNYDAYEGSVRVLGTPSTCVQFAPRVSRYERDARAPAYRWMRLGPSGEIETEVERIGWWSEPPDADRRP